MKRKNVHCILRYHIHCLITPPPPTLKTTIANVPPVPPLGRPFLCVSNQKEKERKRVGKECETPKKLNNGERVVKTFELDHLQTLGAQIQSRNVPVRTLELAATPNDPFSECQSTPEPPKSSLEPQTKGGDRER